MDKPIAEDLKVLHGVASEGIGIAKYQKVIVKLIERVSAAEARVKELETKYHDACEQLVATDSEGSDDKGR